MTERRASCSCGQLSLHCLGEPVRISICHCLACQQRTGSVFGVQARYPRTQIREREGRASQYVRIGDSGGRATFYFCPECAATIYWDIDRLPEYVAVAVGAFAEPGFPPPKVSVYEARRHAWAEMPGLAVEHQD